MKRPLFIIIILLIAKSGLAQYKETSKNFGDKAFSNKNYYEAAFYYKKAADGLSLIVQQAIPYHASRKKEKKGKPEDRAYICYQLGESYRLYENYLEAETWYFKVLDENFEGKYPIARLWYGVCLRANQHFDEAIKQFSQFKTTFTGDSKYKDIAQKEMDNCQFAKEQYQYPVLIDVSALKSPYYSDGSDYSLVKKDSNIYFTSSRLVKNEKKHLNRVYSITKGKAEPVAISFRDDKNNNPLEYGTPSFSPNGLRMYLTRWYKEGSLTLHAIYTSDFTNGNWTRPVKLNSNVNANGFASLQPFVTPDGKHLYFTSNKVGGQGGDDIWVSDLDINGNPINSVNLGPTINTPLDEQAAYYDAPLKRLIYSSKGFIGLGGFDFFESFYDGEKWSLPKNMGYPFNSAKDDLYYFPDHENSSKLYLSSDRESDCCLNLFSATDKRHILAGMVTDCDTRAPLKGVTVFFIDSISKKTVAQVVSDSLARYAFTVTTRRPYYLKLEKDGYFTKNINVPASAAMSRDTLINPEICLQAFKVNKPIVIANVLYDFNKSTLRPESTATLNSLVIIMKDNPKIHVELAAHTDSIGTAAYNMKLSQARAQSCVDYIVSNGIDEMRIYAKGYGKRKPIAPNTLANGRDNPVGRQLNRRTEFTVIKIDPLSVVNKK